MPKKIPKVGTEEFASYMRDHFSGVVDMLREMITEEEFRKNCVFMFGTRIRDPGMNMMLVDMRGDLDLGIELMANMLHSMAMLMEEKETKDTNGNALKKEEALKILLYMLHEKIQKTTPVVIEEHEE